MEKVYNYIINNNSFEYNIRKAAEEFQELALVLTQKSLKPHKVNDKEITDEIGDCLIRMKVIEALFNKDEIKNRVDYKMNLYSGLIDTIEKVQI